MNSRLARRFLTILAVTGLAAACGSSAQTSAPAPSGTLAGASASTTVSATPGSTRSPIAASSAELAVYDTIQTQVERLRRLPPAPAGEPVLLDQAGIREWMTKAYEKADHDALAAASRLFARVGLLPEGASIEKLQLDLNSGQAIGFYDTESKKLYLLSQSGGVGPMQRLTFSHEYAHAMQDHQFDLTKLEIDAEGQSDRGLARMALVEGDASLAMNQWARAHMSLADLLAVSLSDDASAQAAQLEAAPAILRESLLFPYTDGLTFVRGVYASGGWSAVDQIYARPPESSSQILHPELYVQGVKPAFLILSPTPDAAGSGWTIAYQDTMGELQLRVWLAGEKPTAGDSKAAAEAVGLWGGDRIGLFEGPNGAWAVVLRTSWRSEEGRTAFVQAAAERLAGLKGVYSVCSDGLLADLVLASSQTVLSAFGACEPAE